MIQEQRRTLFRKVIWTSRQQRTKDNGLPPREAPGLAEPWGEGQGRGLEALPLPARRRLSLPFLSLPGHPGHDLIC